MYNKLDLCHIEILITFYSLLFLFFGAEYNHRYLTYQKSYLDTQIYLALAVIPILLYVNYFGCAIKVDMFESFFTSHISNNLFLFPLLLLTFISIACHQAYSKTNQVNSFEYIALLFFGCLGLIVLGRANDLLLVYLGLELSSFCFYILTTYKRDSSYATEAGLKYFLLGAIASGNFLFAIILFYSSGATTNYQLLETLVLALDSFSGEVLLQQLGLIFLLLSILFKLASFPFHSWAIDVYDGGPLSSVVFLNTTPKLGFVFLLVNVLFSLGIPHVITWQTILLITGTMSIFWGALAGIKQKRLKRLLAISSVGNIGFTLVAFSTGTFQGIVSGIFYLISYLMATINCWLILISYNQNPNSKLTLNFVGLRSLFVKVPITSYIIALIFMSFAGIPPFLGFVSKYLVFMNLMNASLFLWTGLIVLFSLFSTFYYLRIVKIVCFETLYDPIQNIKFTPMISWIISWLFLSFALLSLYPQPLCLLHLFFSLDLIL